MNKKNKHPASEKKCVDNIPPVKLLSRDIAGLNIFDLLLAPLLGVVAAIWSFFYIGTSIEWDDLLYMNLSHYTTPQTWVLNRYGHIYFQKFFMWLCGDALVGAKLYWCVLIFGTSVLVYWCAKILSRKTGVLVGLVAVVFFFMQQIFFWYPGCTFSDFTVMFLLTLSVFIYLAFVCGNSKYRHFFVLLLGLTFFWAVKSKETGICMVVLFLGLGQREDGSLSMKGFFKDIGWLLLGMFSGCVLLMALDLAFIGDALFSIRISSFKECLSFVYKHRPDQPPRSVYGYFSTNPLLATLLLYVIVGCGYGNRSYDYRKKLVWLIPLVSILFPGYVRWRFHFSPRYYASAIPLISLWAAQFFQFDFKAILLKRQREILLPKVITPTILIIVSFVSAHIFMRFATNTAVYSKIKNPATFYAVVIMPLAISLLFITGAFSTKRKSIAAFFSLLSFFMLAYLPLKHNVEQLQKQAMAKRSEWRYEPYRVFADELQFNKNTKILVSKNIHIRSWMLGRDVTSHCWMFNIFFNQKFDYNQFVDGSWEDILKTDYTYAFLTWQDWKGIREKHNTEHLLRKYTLKPDKKTQLILFKSK